jgi:hypothetical protein
MSYSPLPSHIDDSEAFLGELSDVNEKAELVTTKLKIQSFSIWILHLIILTISFSMLVSSYWRAARCQKLGQIAVQDDIGYERIYCKFLFCRSASKISKLMCIVAPLWEAVRYEKQVFYSDVEAGKKFMGKPRPELDEAWASITDGMCPIHHYYSSHKRDLVPNLSDLHE